MKTKVPHKMTASGAHLAARRRARPAGAVAEAMSGFWLVNVMARASGLPLQEGQASLLRLSVVTGGRPCRDLSTLSASRSVSPIKLVFILYMAFVLDGKSVLRGGKGVKVDSYFSARQGCSVRIRPRRYPGVAVGPAPDEPPAARDNQQPR